MHEHSTLLQDLAVIMCVAALTTILFRQIKQPVVLGYILAGLIIGPHTPPVLSLIHDQANIGTLAELGAIFLMFALGLEFSFRKLQKVGATAFIAAFLEILLMVLAGFQLGQFFGWGRMDSVFLGAILAISSTTIIIKALEGLGKKNESFASIIIGILIVEDILAIVMIALLSGFAKTGQIDAGGDRRNGDGAGCVPGNPAGRRPDPCSPALELCVQVQERRDAVGDGDRPVLRRVPDHGEAQLQRGARRVHHRSDHRRVPANPEDRGADDAREDLFSAIFFVSIGLLIDPKVIIEHAWPIVFITIVVVVGKVLACSLGSFVAGNDTRTSMKVGMSLAQIGEFSFIIAALGLQYGVTSKFLYPIAVAVSAITTLLTPYLIGMSDGLVNWFHKVAPRPLLNGMEAYSQWVGGLKKQNESHFERKILDQAGGRFL